MNRQGPTADSLALALRIGEGIALKDLLFDEGHDVKTPRAVVRKSFEVDYIDESDCETLLDALDKHNLLSHAYLLDVAQQAETLIKECYHPALLELHRTLDARRTP